jgi:16S rRNA (guanine1207-N2)-methyltransferase
MPTAPDPRERQDTAPQHYFTADPASQEERRVVDVQLAGRPIRLFTASGVFSPDRLDKGTAVLLRHVPEPPVQGTFLDLGCGWGPLALSMALASAQARVYAVDVNRRALELTRRNAEATGAATIVACEPEEVPGDLSFDLIWSNPAIRIGKVALHEMLLLWLPRLAPGGSAYLVVSKNLGADSLQTWLAGQDPRWEVQRHASDKGFRVLRVHLPVDTSAA